MLIAILPPFLGDSIRGLLLSVFSVMLAVGLLLVCVVGSVLPWDHLSYVCATPSAILLVFSRFLPQPANQQNKFVKDLPQNKSWNLFFLDTISRKSLAILIFLGAFTNTATGLHGFAVYPIIIFPNTETFSSSTLIIAPSIAQVTDNAHWHLALHMLSTPDLVEISPYLT